MVIPKPQKIKSVNRLLRLYAKDVIDAKFLEREMAEIGYVVEFKSLDGKFVVDKIKNLC